MSKIKYCFLSIFSFFLLACSDDTPEFTNDWDEDIYYFGKNLKEKHKDLFFSLSEVEFDSDILSLRNESAAYSDSKIYFELAKIVSKIGDSHTGFQYGNRITSYPFRIKWLDDGIILDRTDDAHAAHLGKKVIKINDMPIMEVVDLFRELAAYENESNFKNQAVGLLSISEFYYELGISDSPTKLTLTLEDNTEYKVSTTFSATEVLEVNPLPSFLKSINQIYWYEELTDDNILYIQYNSCQERNDLSFRTFTEQISDRINENSSIHKLVIDLRHNGGGNSSIMHPLIEELQDQVSANRFTKDQIYLIIGRKTFSSAILNTYEIQEKIDPQIFGEPSGGKPNHYGEIKSFQLPNSRLSVFYSTKYFTLGADDEDAFYPDVQIEYTSNHFLDGVDPVLEAIKQD